MVVGKPREAVAEDLESEADLVFLLRLVSKYETTKPEGNEARAGMEGRYCYRRGSVPVEMNSRRAQLAF